MVDLKHCPSAPPVDNSDVPLLQRMKEHAIEFYEASPEQHRQCLRNTFNKYMSKLSAATASENPVKHSDLHVSVTTGQPTPAGSSPASQ
ncbi:hypothetical protein ACKKBG_A11810 [Auxenochlorella protothecoides x Auxenochlorella symbiontica]